MTALTKIFRIKWKNWSRKVGKWLSRCFEKKSFRSRKISSGQFDFSFDYCAGKFAKFWKDFGKPTSRNSAFLYGSLYFKRPSGDVAFSHDQPDEKFLPKIELFRSKCQIDIKKPGCLQKKLKKNQWRHNMKCSLDNPAESCSPKLWKIFGRSEKKTYRIAVYKFILSSKCLVGIVGSEFANPAEKCLTMSDNFLLNSVVNYMNFLENGML